MKKFQIAVFGVGLGMLALLLWKMDAGAVWEQVAMVRWGFLLIITQEIVAHIFNAYGWRLAFRSEQAKSFSVTDLIYYRIVGDGVNYLTPSAQIAGEFTRASMLNPQEPVEIRTSGVVIAKFGQGFAQFLFVVFGIALFLNGRIPAIAPYEQVIRLLAGIFAALMLAFVAFEKWFASKKRRESSKIGTGLWSVPKRLQLYLRDHPGRFSLSIFMFLLGYTWGAFEVYWICRFIGLDIGFSTAMLIEVLSAAIDGLLFMVPAKVGTQEAGKTAIFMMLGLPAQSGLAFGIVRHIRELTWASSGLALYSRALKLKRKDGAARRVDQLLGSGAPPQAAMAPSTSTE